MSLLLLVPLAFAQADESMIIEAERDVVVARAVLDDVLEERGYISLGRRDVLYIHPQLWRPRARISEDGLISIRSWRSTPMTFVPGGTVMATDQTVLSIADAIKQPASAPGVAGVSSNRRTKQRMESDLLAALEAPLQDWQDAIWARERLYRDESIRQQLHATWDDGTRSFAERRAALVGMWLNTTDNADGLRVQQMIEVFLDERVQTSGHPLTAEEIDAANAQRPSARRLEPVPAG